MIIRTGIALSLLAVLIGSPGLAQPPGYVLQPQDVVEITVWRHSDLDTVVEVDQDGYISLPLAGKVKAVEMTVRELESELTRLWGDDYIKEPYVRVNLREKRFFVFGEVREPGSYELVGNITAMKAISMAGGFTPYAAKRTIHILRDTENGLESIEVDFSAIQRGRTEDVEIRPGDVVTVRQSFF